MKHKIWSMIFLLSVTAMIFGCGKTDDINDPTELEAAEVQESGDYEDRVTENLETVDTHESKPEKPATTERNTHESTTEEQTTETVTEERNTIGTTTATTERITEAPATEASTTEAQATEPSSSTQEEANTSTEYTVNRDQPEGNPVPYNPQNVVSLAIGKCKAGGMILTSEDLNQMLADGQITQEMYNEYYPTDGLGYFSVFIETDMSKASTISGQRLESEDAIASHLAGMLLLENSPYFYIECAGVTNYHGEDLYEFRCYR